MLLILEIMEFESLGGNFLYYEENSCGLESTRFPNIPKISDLTNRDVL